MKKLVSLIALLALTACGALSEKQQHQADVDASVEARTERAVTMEDIRNAAASAASTIEESGPSSSAESSSPPKQEVRTVLVDQDYSGIASIKGLAWVKAIGTKRLSGTSENTRIEVTISRNGMKAGIDTVGIYFAQLNEEGVLMPETEWRHVRYVDAQHLHGTRALAGSSNLSTLGVESKTETYAISEIPVTPACNYDVSPAKCSDGTIAFDLAGALSEGDVWLGFLPSRSTAHVTVTLIDDGAITVTQAVK